MAELGIHLPTFDPTRSGASAGVVEAARLAEQAGFDSLWVGDHLWCPAPVLEATACLAAAAAVTERVALGFSVMLLALRNPAWAAKQLTTLDQLAPGRRLTLGLGVGGEFRGEFELAGVEYERRGRLLDDAAAELGSWLTERLEPPISAMPPIYFGGRGERALARVAAGGDGWLPIWVSPERVRSTKAQLAERAAAHGRAAPRVALLLGVNVNDSQTQARQEADAYVRGQYRMGFDQVERWSPVGSAESVAEYIAEHVAAGVDEFILMPLTPDPSGQIERLAGVREALGYAARR